jgi:hypothetical protein
MNLEQLRQRLEYEQGAEKDDETVRIITLGGEHYDILSVNWDDENNMWVIIVEEQDE